MVSPLSAGRSQKSMEQDRITPLRTDPSAPKISAPSTVSSSRKGYSYTPYSVALNPEGKIAATTPYAEYGGTGPNALTAMNRAAYGVTDEGQRPMPQEQQQFLREGAPDVSSGALTALDKHLQQQQALLEPGYNWSTDPATLAMREDAEQVGTAARSRLQDTMQGGASSAALAREMANWDAEVRKDVNKYIAQRKLQAEQNVSSIIADKARLEAAQSDAERNYELQRMQLMQNYQAQEQARQDREWQQSLLNPANILPTAAKLGAAAYTGGIDAVAQSILGDSLYKSITDPNGKSGQSGQDFLATIAARLGGGS